MLPPLWEKTCAGTSSPQRMPANAPECRRMPSGNVSECPRMPPTKMPKGTSHRRLSTSTLALHLDTYTYTQRRLREREKDFPGQRAHLYAAMRTRLGPPFCTLLPSYEKTHLDPVPPPNLPTPDQSLEKTRTSLLQTGAGSSKDWSEVSRLGGGAV